MPFVHLNATIFYSIFKLLYFGTLFDRYGDITCYCYDVFLEIYEIIVACILIV